MKTYKGFYECSYDGADAIGEEYSASSAEISWEEREPRGEKLRSGSEIRGGVVEEERVGGGGGGVGTIVVGLRLLVVVLFHGALSQLGDTRDAERK